MTEENEFWYPHNTVSDYALEYHKYMVSFGETKKKEMTPEWEEKTRKKLSEEMRRFASPVTFTYCQSEHGCKERCPLDRVKKAVHSYPVTPEKAMRNLRRIGVRPRISTKEELKKLKDYDKRFSRITFKCGSCEDGEGVVYVITEPWDPRFYIFNGKEE